MSVSTLEEEEDQDNLFQHLNVIETGSPDALEQTSAASSNANDDDDTGAPRRKPLWWRQLSARRGSKGQRRAYHSMVSHKLHTVPYGQEYDFSSSSDSNIWLEIGSGQGDNLLRNAELHANVKMLGADVHKPGVGLTLMRIEKALDSGEYWKDYTVYNRSIDPFARDPQQEQAATSTTVGHDDDNATRSTPLYDNLRIFPGDGMKLLKRMPTCSLSAILLTFPDPWFKEYYKEHRLLQSHTLEDIFRVLKGGGRFYLATDSEVFRTWSVELFENAASEFQPIIPTPDRMEWLPVVSKYEQKGWEEGRESYLHCWEAIKET